MTDIVERLKSGDFYQREGFDAAAAEITALREKLEVAERERDNARANSVSRGKMLIRLRNALINIKDELDDEGDLVAFGSTNHADEFKDAVNKLDMFRWGVIMREADEDDLLSACQRANARADALQARADALQARVERLEKALRFYAERMTYTSRTGMDCGITKDHFGDCARAALAADGENNGRDG